MGDVNKDAVSKELKKIRKIKDSAEKDKRLSKLRIELLSLTKEK